MPEGLFYHGGIRLSRLIGYTSIPYFSGLLGGLSELSAGTIFPLMVFAAALQLTACLEFIIKIAYRIGGNPLAGPAQLSLFSSGTLWPYSGSCASNVPSLRSLTLPCCTRVVRPPDFSPSL